MKFNSVALNEALSNSPKSIRLIAQEAGVSEDCIYKLKAGVRSNPMYATVVRIARAIGCTPDSLYSEHEVA
jgi:DNA-binding phage protein